VSRTAARETVGRGRAPAATVGSERPPGRGHGFSIGNEKQSIGD
jgi:hypothetical protein